MKKSFLAGVTGITTIIATIFVIAYITQFFFPLPVIPPSEDNVKYIMQLFIHSSKGLLLGKLLAGILSGLSGGYVISLMKGTKKTALIVSLLFSLLAGYYMVMVLTPLWFWLLLVLSFFPCTLTGFSLASYKNQNRQIGQPQT